MRLVLQFALLTTLTTLILAGCESHQTKVDALQKEYDQLASQFHQDCSAEYLTIPPTVSQRCTEEDKKVKEAWSHLQAERAKQ